VRRASCAQNGSLGVPPYPRNDVKGLRGVDVNGPAAWVRGTEHPRTIATKIPRLPDCNVVGISSCWWPIRRCSMPSGSQLLPRAIAAGERSGMRPSTLLVGVTSRFGRRGRLNAPRYKLFWQTIAIAASMLLFASLRPSTRDVTVSDTIRSTIFAPNSNVLRPAVSGKRSQRIGLSKMAGMRMRQSDSFVAKDFTNHFNLHAQSIAIVQKSDLTHSGQRQ
jgi:hypothetical protein